MRNTKKLWSTLMGFALVGAISLPSIAGSHNENPGIAPLQSKPYGHSYSEWAAEFWQWALEQPATGNPVLDTSGEFCRNGQPKKGVWFLAGTFGDPGPVNRTCIVPTGRAIFFPVIDAIYGAFLNDPPETRTEEFLRAQVDCTILSAYVEFDGRAVKNPEQYIRGSEKSLFFDVQLPEDNVFGFGEDVVPELLLSPSVESGLYLFLFPLSVGTHTLHWEASQQCPFGPFAQDITYTLVVKSGHH